MRVFDVKRPNVNLALLLAPYARSAYGTSETPGDALTVPFDLPRPRRPVISLADIPITDLHVTLVPGHPWTPPPDLGVTLRGALGAAIMDVACVRVHRICTECEISDCVVPGWYDPGRVNGAALRPFSLEVRHAPGAPIEPDAGLDLRWTFVGSIPRPSLVQEAIFRAAQIGLGPERVRHRVARVAVGGAEGPIAVIEYGQEAAPWPGAARLGDLATLTEPTQGLIVRFTPRVSLTDRGAHHPPSPADLLRRGVDRIRSVARALGVTLGERWPDPETVPAEWIDLEFVSHGRYSRRQGERIDLSGWRGSAWFGPEIEPFIDLLAALEVLQVGRHTSAGIGCVSVAPAGA